MKVSRSLSLFLLFFCLSTCVFAQGSGKVVKVSPGESAYKIRRGGSALITVVIDIEEGYHINSNRPSDKNLIPTALKVERAAGLTTSAVRYPKAKLRKFEFSSKPLSVFEGKAVLRLTARASHSPAQGPQELKAKLTVQACNNQACLRPQTIEFRIPVLVE